MKAALNGHVEQERHVMFQRSADEVRALLKQMVKTLKETLDEKADEIFLAMRRDYRSVLGGSDLPQGELLPKAQRLMRKEVMGKLGKVEKIFRKVAGLEVEYEDEEVGPTANSDTADDSGSAGQYIRSLETQHAVGVHESMIKVPIATTGIKTEAAEHARTDPTSNTISTTPTAVDPTIIEEMNARQPATRAATASNVEPSSIAKKENDDHAHREPSYELMPGSSREVSEESEESWAADEDSD